MNREFFPVLCSITGAALLLSGCVSTEETGAGDRAKSPVQILGSIDTTHRAVRQVPLRAGVPESEKPFARTAPRFSSRQDTVKASVITRPRSSARTVPSAGRADRSSFTVQIGAYTRVSNALRAQKSAKRRFADQPVFSQFAREAKLYRVSIGTYENRKEALAFCNAMKRKYPMEYDQCWIKYIP